MPQQQDMTRRSFLRAAAAGATGALGALTVGRMAFATPGLAARVGPLAGMAARRLSRIGLQLYTVRDLMKRDVAGTLRAVARIGYREVEFAGLFGTAPRAMAGLLGRIGLAAPSSHISMQDIRQHWAATLADAAIMGQSWIVCPWIDENERTPDGYRRVADELNRAGQIARKHGLRLAYHNHDYEFSSVGGIVPYDLLLERCDPASVAMELDVYWALSGGRDPLALLKAHPGRFPLLHLKGRSASGTMVDVGRGVVDWRGLLHEATVQGLAHAFVEHDQPPSPLADARVSYTYLENLEF